MTTGRLITDQVNRRRKTNEKNKELNFLNSYLKLLEKKENAQANNQAQAIDQEESKPADSDNL